MQYVGSDTHLHHLRSRAQFPPKISMSACAHPVTGINMPTVIRRHGHRGRPLLGINIDQVELLRTVGYSWQEVADAIGASRTTVWRHLQEQNIMLSSLSDQDLYDLGRTIQRNFPNAGLVMIQGHLRSQGVHVQRHRVRESVAHNDPICREIRGHE